LVAFGYFANVVLSRREPISSQNRLFKNETLIQYNTSETVFAFYVSDKTFVAYKNEDDLHKVFVEQVKYKRKYTDDGSRYTLYAEYTYPEIMSCNQPNNPYVLQ